MSVEVGLLRLVNSQSALCPGYEVLDTIPDFWAPKRFAMAALCRLRILYASC